MSDTRARHTMEFRADARDITAAGKRLKEAFNDSQVKALNKQLADTSQRLKDNVENTNRLQKAMGEVQAGTNKYRELSRELRGVNKEADKLLESQRKINQEMGKALAQGSGPRREATAAGFARGGGGGGGGSGGGGGGGGFRNFNYAVQQSQVGMPTFNGFANAMTAIPIGGAMLAGSMIAAGGAYESRLGFERARLGALGSVPVGDILDLPGRQAGYDAQASGREQRARAVFEGARNIRRAVGGEGLYSKMDGALSLSKTEEAVIASQRGPNKSALEEVLDTRGTMDIGQSFGFMPTEAIGRRAAFQTAMSAPTSRKEFATAMGIERAMGIGAEQFGGMMRNMRFGGVERGDEMNKFVDLFSKGISQGLEGSDLVTQLKMQTGILRQQLMAGLNPSFAGVEKLQASLAGFDMDPIVSAQRAGNVSTAFQTIGARGGGGAPGFRMLKAVAESQGIDINSSEGFAKANLAMQDGDVMTAAMPHYFESLRSSLGDVKDEASRTMLMQRMLSDTPGMGTVTKQFASNVLNNRVKKFKKPEQPVTADALIRAGQVASRAAGGNVIAEAGLERDRIGIGGEIAGTMQEFSRMINNLAGAAADLNPVFQAIGTSGADAAGGLRALTDALKASGFTGGLGAMLGVQLAPDAVYNRAAAGGRAALDMFAPGAGTIADMASEHYFGSEAE